MCLLYSQVVCCLRQASLSDRRDASQRFLVSAFIRVARQRQSQYEFDWHALFRETPNNLISCHYYNKSLFLICFLLGVSSFIFNFFPFMPFFLLHFICLFLPYIAFYFFHFHDCFILHFTLSLYNPFDRHTQNILHTSNDILTLSTVYYSAPNTAMGQESKIQLTKICNYFTWRRGNGFQK